MTASRPATDEVRGGGGGAAAAGPPESTPSQIGISIGSAVVAVLAAVTGNGARRRPEKMPTSSLQKRLFPREIRNSVDYLATWDHSSLHLDRSSRVCRAQRREVRGGGGGGAAVVARSGTTRTTLRSAASVDAGSRTGERRRRQPDVDRSRFHVDADALPHSVRLEPTHRAAAPGAEADVPPTEKCQSLETRPVSRPEMWSRRRGQTSGQNGGEASIRLTSGQHRGEGERSLMSF